MPGSQISSVIGHLRRAAGWGEHPELTDGQLLESFVRRQEPMALEALVRRHGPMVWGVCRRILRGHHDIEDAFQATFLVLVRKAASIAPREMVGNWLYGVAQHTALRARAIAAKRRVRERQQADVPEPTIMDKDLWNEVQPLLDQELRQLPDKYRAVVVLCDLEGMTRKKAALQLGLPEGTVASRLARARSTLARRLGKHGLSVTGCALGLLFARGAAAQWVPSAVMSATIQTVTQVAAGQVAPRAIPATVAALTEGAIQAMWITKLRTALVMLLAVVALSGAMVLFCQAQTSPPRPVPVDKQKKQQADALMPVKTVLGPKAFQDGDGIEITGVRATSARLEQGDSLIVRGRFLLGSRDSAQLCLSVTQHEGDGLGPSTEMQVKRGKGDFELKATIENRGSLHVTFYDQAGNPFGGVYFGTEAQMKEIEDWSLDYYLENVPKPAGGVKAAPLTIQSIVRWSGTVENAATLKALPDSGLVTSQKTFAELWKSLRPSEEVPEVDFASHFVAVHTFEARRIATMELRVDDKGDASLTVTRHPEGKGLGYGIAVFPRAQVRTFGLRPIQGN
jgi:RNA polymerase sigma factor (sigma-70 family)